MSNGWEKDVTLEISNIQSEDYGRYECHARNVLGDDRKSMQLCKTHYSQFRLIDIILVFNSLVKKASMLGECPVSLLDL